MKKLQVEADVEAYEIHAKSACSDFRIIVERTVEFILLADVIGRFRRAINTQNKLHKVAKVTNADCVFIDDLMTRYSVFEHSQSDELPSNALELDEFETDVNALNDWLKEFVARAA